MSTFEVVKGEAGKCLLLDGTRIAGPKAWGGGTVESTFTTKETFYQERTCEWHQDEDGYWHTQCGEIFVVCNCESLEENRIFFCYNCGAKVVENAD